ncbi:MAG: acyltransferase family protein [Mangrovibacterium sp.]
MRNSNASFLQSKEHFHILDGLRGIAALVVVVFHFMEWIEGDFTKNIIGHGFLAVDFFFCLSGFVIAYAYDNRMPQMGFKKFFVARLIRLHPLVILGTVLGVIALFADPFANHAEGYSLLGMLLIVLCSLFMIPYPVMEERFFNLFSLNAPSWSLFWEYIASIVYGLILVRLPRKVTGFLLVLSAAGLLWIGHSAGNTIGGWDGSTFWHGGVRVSFSFLAGLFIYRSGWIIKNKLGFMGVSLLLALAFFTSFITPSWITECVIVMLYFPLIVSLGAGSILRPSTKKTCVFMGNISYPLYMTHYAFIWIFGHYLESQSPSQGELAWVVSLGTIGMVIFAWLAMKFYDTPVRNFLKKKFS